MISAVARPILVVGSKPNLVHGGRGGSIKFFFMFRYVRYGAIIAEVQSGGNLCWAAQCILLRVLGENIMFWAGPPGTANCGYNASRHVTALF